MTTKERYSREIAEVIAKAKSWREVVTVTAADGAEIFAYARPEGRVAWGVNSPETGVIILRGIRRPDGTDEADGLPMKLKPEEHQKDAEDLRDLADLSTRPNEKRGLLSLAAGLESLAKLGENEALLLDVRAELGEVRNEVGELRKEVTAIQNNLITLRADLPGIIASAVAAILREEMARKG